MVWVGANEPLPTTSLAKAVAVRAMLAGAAMVPPVFMSLKTGGGGSMVGPASSSSMQLPSVKLLPGQRRRMPVASTGGKV